MCRASRHGSKPPGSGISPVGLGMLPISGGAGPYNGVSKDRFPPLALLLLPPPSSSASDTQMASAVWDKARDPEAECPWGGGAR